MSFTKRPSDPSYGFVHSPVKLAWEYKLSVNESFQRLLMKRKTAQDRGAFKEMVEMENGIKHYKEFKGVVDLIGNSTLVELNLSLVDEGEYCCTVYVNLPGWKDRATSCVRLIVVGKCITEKTAYKDLVEAKICKQMAIIGNLQSSSSIISYH